jgi:hypothetical protein
MLAGGRCFRSGVLWNLRVIRADSRSASGVLSTMNKKTDSWQLTIDKLPRISENPIELVEFDMMSGHLSWKEHQQV